MKKLILFFFALLFFIPAAHAGECVKITDVDDYWVVVKSGVNIRDQVCDGNVIGTLSAGTKVKVTGHIEDWRYIERPDGGVGFVWGEFVEPTTAPADVEPEQPKEPLYDIIGNMYEDAIRYLYENEIIAGYPDGSYQPARNVNRAEFTKIIVGAKLGSEPSAPATACFPDVPKNEWFSTWVCYAKEQGIIGGYPDGNFKPADPINLAEASKILVNTLDVPKAEVKVKFPWFQVYIDSMQDLNYIPSSFDLVSDLVSRSEMAEMVWRIMENVTDEPAKTFVLEPEETSGSTLACADQSVPASVDIDAVRSAWFSWVNEARAAEGKGPYNSSEILDATAQAWADHSAEVGTLSHSRPGATEYYDYSLITQWFADLGVTFKNVGGWTYSENIGRTFLNCNQSDCTQELIDGTKLIFDAYMAEKGTSSAAHYESVMGNFNLMGIAWAFKGSRDVYVTVHYAAEIDQAPSLTCN